ncbi:MAG: serine hydrolase [Gemmatimonadaceae bacterium]|nr:serine hydrolase [Gemmatimonadaceae bacterium]
MIRLCVAAALLATTTPLLPAQTTSPQLAPATAAAIDSLFTPMSHAGSPGCAVAVYQNGAIAFARGYGFANLTHDVPITPATRFTVGSVSKQFTAASIALLVRAGKLSLDDDVRRYIPEMNATPTPVRVRHLVHHTSGLRDFWELVGLAGVRYDDGYTSQDMLALAARQKGLNFPPGAEYRYSNTGYLALGVIVQRVTGQSLRRFADSAIFQPLGMQETLFLDDHTEVVAGRAMAYSPVGGAGGRWKVDVWNNDIVGQGGVVTSLADLQKWDENFYTGKVGGREFLELMHQVEPLTSGASNAYAFGISVGNYRGQRLVEHTGATGGYRAALFRFPDQHTSFAMLCNRSITNTTQLSLHMADAVLRASLGAPSPRGSTAGEEASAPRKAGTPRVREHAAIAGRYASPELMGAVYEIAVAPDGTLQLTRPRATSVALSPLEPERAYVAGGLLTLTFDAPVKGKSPGFRLDANRVQNIRFDRLAP